MRTHTVATEIPYQFYGFGQVVFCGQGVFDLRQGFADVEQNDVRALLRKSQRVAAPHAAGGPSDQNAFTGNASRG